MKLTQKTSKVDGRRVVHYDWHGKEVLVRDDADTGLQVIALLNEDIDPQEKFAQLLTSLFIDIQQLENIEDLAGLLSLVCWETIGLDIRGDYADEISKEKVLDWEDDAEYIEASLLAAYGLSWEVARYEFGYRQICSMLGLIDRDTPMGQALYYRTADPPRPNKYNEEEVRNWRKAHDFWALKSKKDAYQDVNDRMNDAFDALERMARG